MKKWVTMLALAWVLCMVPALTAEAAADSTKPANPVHHCTEGDDGTDTTDWSYIYFGSYPQSEVIWTDLTEEIMDDTYDENGDAWVNGIKYRRIQVSDTKDMPYVGKGTYRYFKWEKIKWRVLSVDDSTMFVMSDKGLDRTEYHDKYEKITWADCTLRSWLNNDFYQTAFDESEQGAIAEQTIVTEDNPEYGTEGGDDTDDKVFALSLSEVTNPEYGFCSNYKVYSSSRRVQASDYAHAAGAFANNDIEYFGNCNWWLRSPGASGESVLDSTNKGLFNLQGTFVAPITPSSNACVPAMHISLSSDLWTLADSGSGEAEVKGPNPVHHCSQQNNSQDATDWTYIYFGSYPQSRVMNQELTAAITGAAYDANGDAWVNGTKYRRISEADLGLSEGNQYHYYKWEKIKWRVLSVKGSMMFAVSDRGLDGRTYHEPVGSVTWEGSALRSWMNDDFYHTAFDGSEQAAIIEQNVVNEDNYYYNIEGGNDTKDCVFLLSISEAENPEYGFCQNRYSKSRLIKSSDYAWEKGAYGDEGCCWWLRTPGSDTDYAAYVSREGEVTHGAKVDDSNIGVVPALCIDYFSGVWSVADDGNGGTNPGKDPVENPDQPQEPGQPQNPNPPQTPAGGNQSIGVGGGSAAGPVNPTPKATTIQGKIKPKKKAFVVTWKKQASVTGYQVQYSTSKKFTAKTTKQKTVKGTSKTKLTVKKLKAGKKYYVKVRTMKKANGKTCYSKWSKVKTVKTKK